MTMRNLQTAPNDQLIATYIELSQNEDDAMLRNDIGRATRLVRQRKEVDDILRARGIQARRMLLPLLEHPNAQVRLNAAKHLLAVAPAEARATLEDLAAHGPGQQEGSAGMCLLLFDEGTFKPT
jgi:HEAT repeat protein